MSERFKGNTWKYAIAGIVLGVGASLGGAALLTQSPTEEQQRQNNTDPVRGDRVWSYDDSLIIVEPKIGADKPSEESIAIAQSACKSVGTLPLRDVMNKRPIDVDVYFGKIPWRTSTAVECSQGSIDPNKLRREVGTNGKTQ